MNGQLRDYIPSLQHCLLLLLSSYCLMALLSCKPDEPLAETPQNDLCQFSHFMQDVDFRDYGIYYKFRNDYLINCSDPLNIILEDIVENHRIELIVENGNIIEKRKFESDTLISVTQYTYEEGQLIKCNYSHEVSNFQYNTEITYNSDINFSVSEDAMKNETELFNISSSYSLDSESNLSLYEDHNFSEELNCLDINQLILITEFIDSDYFSLFISRHKTISYSWRPFTPGSSPTFDRDYHLQCLNEKVDTISISGWDGKRTDNEFVFK